MAATEKPKLLSLELGRFLAASLVVLTHLIPFTEQSAAPGAAPLFGGWLPPGAFGVQFFFVLSGFVIASAHAKDFGHLAALPKFWWRRICRIYPVYWLALLIPIYFLYGALTPGFSLQLFTLSPWHDREFVAPAWSLRYEITFYLMFSLCLLPRIGKPILGLWVFCTLWRWVPGTLLSPLHLSPPQWFDRAAASWGDKPTSFFGYYFFAGLLGAWLFHARAWSRKAAILITSISAALLLAALARDDWGNAYGSPLFILCDAALMAPFFMGLASLEPVVPPRFAKSASFAGALSYPIYILHAPILLLLANALPKLHLSAPALYGLFLAELSLLYALSAAVAVWFDQPVQRLLRQLTGRLRAARRADPAGLARPMSR